MSAETLTLAWDANADPQLSGYIVHIGSVPGSYSQHIDVGNVTQYEVTADPGQHYCFSVSAYADGPIEGQTSSEVCVNSNAAPSLTSPGEQVTPVGTPLTVPLSAVDPESETLTYTVTGLPAGLTVTANTGIISGTPTQTGTSTVTATVSDGRLSVAVSFNWVVTGSAPGAATLLRPTGTLTATSPTYEWTAVPTATHYRLWVDDAGNCGGETPCFSSISISCGAMVPPPPTTTRMCSAPCSRSMSIMYLKYSLCPPWYELQAIPSASSWMAARTMSATLRL